MDFHWWNMGSALPLLVGFYKEKTAHSGHHSGPSEPSKLGRETRRCQELESWAARLRETSPKKGGGKIRRERFGLQLGQCRLLFVRRGSEDFGHT